MGNTAASRSQLDCLWDHLERKGYDPEVFALCQCNKDYADLTTDDCEQLKTLASDVDEEEIVVYPRKRHCHWL